MDAFVSARSRVETVSSAPQVTPTSRGGNFGRVLANAALSSAEGAILNVPGAPIMALALRSATGATSSAIFARPPAGIASAGGMSAAAGPSPNPGPLTSDAASPGLAAGNLEGALAGTRDANLYYLQVQERVNAENRSFTTLSNVLKAEHETVKTAIGNIR